jgi:hypothetical protein
MKSWIKNNKVYIIPSLRGSLLIFLDFILLIAGLSYNNNIVLGICFLLFTLIISCMFESHFYFDDIKISDLEIEDGFEGEKIKLNLKTDLKGNSKKFTGSIRIKLSPSNLVKYKGEISTQSHLFFTDILKMGKYQTIWVEVKNYSPNFLFRTWKYLKIDKEFYIYPHQENIDLDFQYNSGSLISYHQGDTVFFDPYNELMAQKNIHWKKSLMMGELFVKNLQSGNEKKLHIALDKMSIHQSAYALNMAQISNCPYTISKNEIVLDLPIKEALRSITPC